MTNQSMTAPTQQRTPGIITRARLERRNGLFAWQWLYSVNDVAIGTSLASAVLWAKEHGFVPTKAWEQVQS